jgi:hypothetical protein
MILHDKTYVLTLLADAPREAITARKSGIDIFIMFLTAFVFRQFEVVFRLS